ncbi:hypothetical protein MMC17_002029 [Xylographa soralifera]|nr:hypothetical protein [Xylographa soralifera]
MHILKVLGGCALLSGGGLNQVLAHPTADGIKRREPSALPATLGMLGDYTIVPLTWEGPITSGGPDVNLTGTISEIKAQILKLNPAFGKFGAQANTTGIAKRNAIVPPHCDVPYPLAEAGPVLTVIDLVEDSIPPFGRCWVPAGPRVCAVVDYMEVDGGDACATTFACNDNDYAIDPGCQYLAGDYAQTIFDTCTSNNLVHGQEFDTDNYNVIVSADCPSGRASDAADKPVQSASNDVQRREPASLGMLGEYTLVPATWVGPITPGGPNVSFTGTLQDVHKKIRELNPNYDSEFGHGNTTGIAKRNAILPPDCNVPYWAARLDRINDAIGLTVGISVGIYVPPGPRVCAVVSGESDDLGCDAIYVCNDVKLVFN